MMKTQLPAEEITRVLLNDVSKVCDCSTSMTKESVSAWVGDV